MVFVLSYFVWSKSKQDFEKGNARIVFRTKLPGKGKGKRRQKKKKKRVL